MRIEDIVVGGALLLTAGVGLTSMKGEVRMIENDKVYMSNNKPKDVNSWTYGLTMGCGTIGIYSIMMGTLTSGVRKR